MPARRNTASQRPPATVDDFFSRLVHPLKQPLHALCKAILDASDEIREGIKWNAPSYYVGDEQFFATVNIHARGKPDEHILVILHRGVKAKSGRVSLDDPRELLEWLSPDRAAVRFRNAADVK